MENYMRGEVFSEVCVLYCRVCVCECVLCVLNFPWLVQWLTTGDHVSTRADSEIQQGSILRMNRSHLMYWRCLHRWKCDTFVKE